MVVSILVFVWLGRPPLFWRILSRVVLIPAIAGLAYEIIRLSARYQGNPLVRIITAPSLMLQMLTTRQPDDDQIEVAIHAMGTTLAADEAAEHGEAIPEVVTPTEAPNEPSDNGPTE